MDACRLNNVQAITSSFPPKYHQSNKTILRTTRTKFLSNNSHTTRSIKAVVDDNISTIVALSDPAAQVEISWQIVFGALAGVTPFIVAGIEFSKRIVAQQQCKVCNGSGLVLRDKKYYFRCPRCGGFLPWQSWRRFFTG